MPGLSPDNVKYDMEMSASSLGTLVPIEKESLDKTKTYNNEVIIDDKNDPTSIPIIISVNPEDYKNIVKNGHVWDIKSIHDIIQKYSEDTYEKIKTMKKNQVVQPDTDTSYDKMITQFVKASEKNIKYTWAIGKELTSDTYQIYLDNRLNRIIVSLYYGSKIAS